MELYAEQSVVNGNIDRKKGRTRVLKIIRYFCAGAVTALAVLFWLLPIGGEGWEAGWTDVLISFFCYLALSVPFVLTFIILGRIIINSSLEFDYYLNGGMFTVTKIISRKKRKKLLETRFIQVESIGRAGSEAHSRIAAQKNIKKTAAYCTADSDDNIVYIYYIDNKIKKLLYITPDGQMAAALRRSAPRLSVIDKSFNKKT